MQDNHRHWPLLLLLGLGIYFALHVVIRATGTAVLELDEAEQVIVTQWWLAGYSGQPPLYDWLQGAVFRVFGVNLWSLSILKNSLLFLTWVFVFLAARCLLGDLRLAVLATLSLFLIPQVAWESQRDLSHSVIVTTVAAASFYMMLRWLDRPHVWNYLLIGLLLGLGVLSKYNFLIFAAAAGMALLSFPRGRAVLLHPNILWSALVAVLVMLPHGLWLWQNRDLGTRSLDKLDVGVGFWPWSGMGSSLVAVLAFLAPLLLVLGVVFKRDFARALVKRRGGPTPFPIHHYFWAVLGLLVLMALFGVSHFKDRWLLPLLLVFPLFIFAMMGAAALTEARVKAFVSVCLMMPLIVLVAMAWRVQKWPLVQDWHRYEDPFNEKVTQARALGFRRGLILGDRAVTAGNLRFRLPLSQAMTPGFNPEGVQCSDRDDLLVAWNAERYQRIPKRLKALLEAELGLSVEDVEARWQKSIAGGGSQMGVLVLPDALAENCRIIPIPN
ncbi:ArnT family glycosyltransferase [Thiorhodovibrio frisius]|uniref:PMT family glycosyltransferase, 4-amino-4-deoxy-L-arabinose transferase n=1 Tax=Thiorhodovibrio frisius TaxID=631362 RepID=H8Z4P1_9GAMM|nr:glycosyltransferase family 39 protein [Thiorhodovibrio frisius]EIC20298.1 PMT family glycosyltransferase, 4-amino-4-deoxy-L-arabinose transferase [Thiorhodovibrio frisius]WPL21036.1 putative membrane protein [Thiorhodovibrio frisius]